MRVDCDAMTLQTRVRSSRLARAGFNARTIAKGHRGDALRHPVLMARFLATTPELSNWTYDLQNADELLALALAAGAVGRPVAELLAYGRELETDHQLRQALRDRLTARRDRSSEPHYGKRVVLYALVRSIGPAVVAEAGGRRPDPADHLAPGNWCAASRSRASPSRRRPSIRRSRPRSSAKGRLPAPARWLDGTVPGARGFTGGHGCAGSGRAQLLVRLGGPGDGGR